jgi:hypothetical protein
LQPELPQGGAGFHRRNWNKRPSIDASPRPINAIPAISSVSMGS